MRVAALEGGCWQRAPTDKEQRTEEAHHSPPRHTQPGWVCPSWQVSSQNHQDLSIPEQHSMVYGIWRVPAVTLLPCAGQLPVSSGATYGSGMNAIVSQGTGRSKVCTHLRADSAAAFDWDPGPDNVQCISCDGPGHGGIHAEPMSSSSVATQLHYDHLVCVSMLSLLLLKRIYHCRRDWRSLGGSASTGASP